MVLKINYHSGWLSCETQQLAKLYGIEPRRSYGQSFLINPLIFDQIVSAANLSKTDQVLEIGPGWGFLTALLAEQANRVVAVELDRRLADLLNDRLVRSLIANVEVVNQDILKTVINRPDLVNRPDLTNITLPVNYKLVANLPYNITSVCLKRFLSKQVLRPSQMVVMVQKEVALRLVAQPGQMSLLSLLAQYYAQVKYLFPVIAKDFWPQPKVDSAVVHFQLIDHGDSELVEKKFWQLARAGFSSRRKMLKKNLVNSIKINEQKVVSALETIGQRPDCRAQDLSVEQWRLLVAYLF